MQHQNYLLDECFPPNIVARQTPLPLQLLFHHHLEASTSGGISVRSHVLKLEQSERQERKRSPEAQQSFPNNLTQDTM